VSIVRAFESAFNRQDVEGLLRCFTGGATYVDNFFGPHTGQAVLRAMFERMFREGKSYSWQMDHVVESPERAAAEWRFSYTVTEAVPRSAGRQVAFSGMSIFELAGGHIAAYREYFDVGIAMLQLGFAPDSLAKVLRRRVPHFHGRP
jgi:limonene-1,2-epoxide hydrolase